MNKLTGIEVINLMYELEAVEPIKIFNNNIEDFYDRVFSKAFGLDWNKISYLKDLRKIINKMTDIIRDNDDMAYLIMI